MNVCKSLITAPDLTQLEWLSSVGWRALITPMTGLNSTKRSDLQSWPSFLISRVHGSASLALAVSNSFMF